MSKTPTPPSRLLNANVGEGAACTEDNSTVAKKVADWANDVTVIVITIDLI